MQNSFLRWTQDYFRSIAGLDFVARFLISNQNTIFLANY